LPDLFTELQTETKTKLHLGQALISNEKMDYLIQKATELGISTITPIYNRYGNIKIDPKKYAAKIKHWEKIAVSSAEQSGRWKVPEIFSPEDFSAWIKKQDTQLKLIFDPRADLGLKNVVNKYNSVSFLVGPEGGFSEEEISLARESGFQPVNLGPRILRSETVAVVVLGIL
jgi:16S rRNA (uracil1498-N3)-methyltransferase